MPPPTEGPSTRPWAPAPRWVIAAGVGSLGVLLALVVAVDVAGAPPAAALEARGSRPVWYHLFQGDSAAEWLQATGLLALVVVAAMASGWLRRSGRRADLELARPLAWLAAAGALLLLEDTGDIGQRVGDWLGYAVGDESFATRAVRLPFFAAGGVALTWALWTGRRSLARHRTAFALLVAGFATYGVMALVGEVLHLQFGVYRPLGRLVTESVFAGRLAPSPDMVDPLWGPYEVVFMDTLWEEAMELVAVTLLLAGVARVARSGDPRGLR